MPSSLDPAMEDVNRRGVPTPIEHAKLLIHLAMEGSLLDAY
jgi:hypothetical protein